MTHHLTPTELEYLVLHARDCQFPGPGIQTPTVWSGYWDRTQDIILDGIPKPRGLMSFRGLCVRLTEAGYFADYELTQLGWDTAVEACAVLMLANGIAQLGGAQ